MFTTRLLTAQSAAPSDGRPVRPHHLAPPPPRVTTGYVYVGAWDHETRKTAALCRAARSIIRPEANKKLVGVVARLREGNRRRGITGVTLQEKCPVFTGSKTSDRFLACTPVAGGCHSDFPVVCLWRFNHSSIGELHHQLVLFVVFQKRVNSRLSAFWTLHRTAAGTF